MATVCTTTWLLLVAYTMVCWNLLLVTSSNPRSKLSKFSEDGLVGAIKKLKAGSVRYRAMLVAKEGHRLRIYVGREGSELNSNPFGQEVC